jgi:riboflavin kinase, archaea type
MKPYLLQTLKELALLGAINNKIEISSLELAKQIESSQQSASRYLVELDKKGIITRELGIKKQLITITVYGEEILQKEHMQYKQIFELTDRILLKGRIVSGLGEGRYYTEKSGYVEQFREKLGFIPFPGTLNVEIEPVEKNKLRLLKNSESININEFKTKDRTFGGVRCFKAKIESSEGAIVLPLRSHYSNVLEFISQDYLRKKLNLKDEDKVKIEIFLDKKSDNNEK